VRIIDFLKSQGGKATSSDIVQHFRIAIAPNDVVGFRKLLKNIAYFEKWKGRKGGDWQLKDKYM
jgi:hypothetical protein